jgi:hypothetical protein
MIDGVARLKLLGVMTVTGVPWSEPSKFIFTVTRSESWPDLGDAAGKREPREAATNRAREVPNNRRAREFREGKKSAQRCIYFIDRGKMEWFKVGESGLIWFNSPAHGFAAFIFKFLCRRISSSD